MYPEFLKKLRKYVKASKKMGVPIILRADTIETLICEKEEVYSDCPLSGASRKGPCWCNGPYTKDTDHHGFCQERRKAWFAFLKTLDNLKPENTKKTK